MISTLSEYCVNRNIAYAHSYHFPVIEILRSCDFRYHTLMIKQQCHITIMYGTFKKSIYLNFNRHCLKAFAGLN